MDWTIEQLRAIWCCASPNADSRRISRILRMDNASSGKADSPCYKQNQIALLDVQRRPVRRSEPMSISRFEPMKLGHSDLMSIMHSELMSITGSEVEPVFDRHQLGTGNRDRLGTTIFIASE